jgi:hypothetical protein
MKILNGKFTKLLPYNNLNQIIKKDFSFQSVSILSPFAFKESKNIINIVLSHILRQN